MPRSLVVAGTINEMIVATTVVAGIVKLFDIVFKRICYVLWYMLFLIIVSTWYMVFTYCLIYIYIYTYIHTHT